jgi:hypothetical protein
MLNGYCWQTRVLEVRPDRLGASVDEMGGNLAIRGANGHPSGFPASGNPFDENTFGQDVVGGNGMKTLFVGNVSLSIFLPRLFFPLSLILSMIIKSDMSLYK